MGRVKGDGKGRLGGRVKGTPNKVTKEAKEALAEVVNGNADKIQDKLNMLVDPKDWLAYYIKLVEFVVPKRAAVNVTSDPKLSDLRSELMELAEKED